MKSIRLLSQKLLCKIVTYGGVAILLASCTQSEDLLVPSQESSHPMSIEERSTALFSKLTQGSLRDGSVATLSSIDSMETTVSETKLYVANFMGGGFLLFRDGGEEQMTLLGYSDTSTLHFSDSEKSPILKQLISNSSIMTYNTINTDIILPGNPDLPGNPNTPNPPHHVWDPDKYVTVVITSKTDYTKYWFKPQTYLYFDQEEPFNNQIKDKHPAGCGPIAIATILSHYEKQAGGSQVDWKLLKRKYNNSYWNNIETMKKEDPKLLHELQILVADTWLYAHILSTTEYTMSSRANVANYLKRAGFKVAYQHEYNHEKICSSLKEKQQPFILMGWSKDKENKKGGHYWVVDGLAQKMSKEVGYVKNNITGKETPFEREHGYSYYIHCTWGWGGSYNGWFNPKLINQYNKEEGLRSSHPSGEYYDLWTYFIWE